MNETGSANLISEIKTLADEIVKMSTSGPEPTGFDERVKSYYGILKDIATELNITENVNVNDNPDVESIRTLTEKIVTKLEETSGNGIKKTIPQEKLQALLDFFKQYVAAINPVKSGLAVKPSVDMSKEIKELSELDKIGLDMIGFFDKDNTKKKILPGDIKDRYKKFYDKYNDRTFYQVNSKKDKLYKCRLIDPEDDREMWLSNGTNNMGFLRTDGTNIGYINSYSSIYPIKQDYITSIQDSIIINDNEAQQIYDNKDEAVLLDLAVVFGNLIKTDSGYQKVEEISGGRRRTRKNKRRITKRKLKKNKNNGKTKKH